jgi:Asp-tRNA(Asn)/Glu-tRNA(Gln) amidotransferase C subunit
MNRREMLIHETEGLTASDLREVLDFVRFLKTKPLKKRSETLTFSESSLRKDWLRPEEDEAWQDL